MNKNYIKITAILIAIMTVYSIVIYIIAANRNTKEDNKNDGKVTENENISTPETPEKEEAIIGDYNIILSPNTILAYKDGKWQENPKLNYKNMLFDVYINNEYKEKKYLSYSDKWYIFDESKNFLDYDGKILAVNTALDYKNLSYMTSELTGTDQNVITSLLNEKGITTNYDTLKKSKIIFDINKDGMRDDIYFISNSFEESNTENKAFSIGFVKYYDKTEVFYDVIKEVDSIYTISNPYLQNILEINGQIYLIVGSEYYSNSGTEHYVYQILNNSIMEVLKTNAN
ncbi:MAG: hypothetical protein J6B98_01060 [Bacilli bacterium]|nr:hypothetical protein [Bacilli bacterium]